MAMGRPKAELSLSEDERMLLTSLARSRSLPARLVQRASLVLACADGVPNSAVAKRFGVTNATVGKWRRRFVEQRIASEHDYCALSVRPLPSSHQIPDSNTVMRRSSAKRKAADS